MYFALGKEVMSGPDYAALEGAIRPWFEPVSISTVAERCGPNSGTPVVRWDAGTTGYTFNQLASGTHYFAVAAYTSGGMESALSSVGSKSIL